MLSKKEWVDKYVYKWKGLMNFDTKTYEGGYLFLWNEERTAATGKSVRNVTNRAQAIAYHYDLYVKAQSNTGLQADFAETCKYCDTPVNAPNFAYHFCAGRKAAKA